MKKILRLLAICLIAVNLSAEDEHRFLFSVIILDPRTGDLDQTRRLEYPLHYELDEEVLPILANVGSKSPLYEYEGPMPVVFFREEISLDEEGEEVITRIPLASIPESRIPSDAERILFILRPVEADRYAYFVIDYSRSKLPVNHVMVMNLGDGDIAFTVEQESPRAVAPGTSAIAERSEGNAYQFFMRLAGQDGENDWRMLTSGFHVAGPETRQLFLVHRYNAQRQWTVQRVHALDDTVPRPDELPEEIQAFDLDEEAPPTEMPDDSPIEEFDMD